MSDEHFRKLENMMHSAPVIKLTGLRASIASGESRMTLAVREELFHAAGAMHGSLYFLALDNAAFFAVNSLVEDVFVLTATFDVRIMKPVSSGEVVAQGKVVSQARSIFTAEAVLYNAAGEAIAQGQGKFMKSKMKLSPEMGYRILER
ncbi:MAG: PaaI family thioesterase [Leptospirales bacterium]|nr:PaaI family thioesterase [Leptospirales bacterium]